MERASCHFRPGIFFHVLYLFFRFSRASNIKGEKKERDKKSEEGKKMIFYERETINECRIAQVETQEKENKSLNKLN